MNRFKIFDQVWILMDNTVHEMTVCGFKSRPKTKKDSESENFVVTEETVEQYNIIESDKFKKDIKLSYEMYLIENSIEITGKFLFASKQDLLDSL